MKEIGDIVRKYESAKCQRYALATLVKTYGSSYRRPGARMLIGEDGSSVGSLSGGCLEEEVIQNGQFVVRKGQPAWLAFDTRRRFGCNGAIEILVESVRPQFLETLAIHYRSRRPVTIGTTFCRDAADVGSRFMNESERRPLTMLIQRVEPPLQLLMIGDGPDSKALRRFSETMGWTVVRMEGAVEIRGPYDRWTAAIVKTHNYGRDFAALRALLPLGLRYVGLVGPRARRDQLFGDMLDIGLEGVETLFAPAGLGLGGDSPEAIALAIIAEIQSVFEEGSCQPLRGLRTSIHARPEGPLPIIS